MVFVLEANVLKYMGFSRKVKGAHGQSMEARGMEMLPTASVLRILFLIVQPCFLNNEDPATPRSADAQATVYPVDEMNTM